MSIRGQDRYKIEFQGTRDETDAMIRRLVRKANADLASVHRETALVKKADAAEAKLHADAVKAESVIEDIAGQRVIR